MNLEDQKNAILCSIEEFQKKLGIENIEEPDFDYSILNIDSETLTNLTAENCSERAGLILRYHFFLTKELNKKKVVLQWVKNVIDKWSAPYWNKYKTSYMSFDLKVYTISQNDNAALEPALRLRNKCQAEIISVEDTISIVRDFYNFYTNHAKIKGWNHG